jgi:hypothetical protein
MYLIGIDVSIQDGNNGLAIYNTTTKQFECIRATSFVSLVGEIADFYKENKAEGCIAVVEDAELDSTVFGAWEAFSQYLKKGYAITTLKSAFSTAMQKAQNVGMQKAAARLTIAAIERLGIEVIRIAPSWRDRADKIKKVAGLHHRAIEVYSMPTKTTAAQFKQLTGYQDSTNEHGRDAATLVWGQTASGLRLKSLHFSLKKRTKIKKIKK